MVFGWLINDEYGFIGGLLLILLSLHSPVEGGCVIGMVNFLIPGSSLLVTTTRGQGDDYIS